MAAVKDTESRVQRSSIFADVVRGNVGEARKVAPEAQPVELRLP